MKTILVIIGSVRPQRIGPAVARWVTGIGQPVIGDAATIELVDLRDWPLPMDEERGIPAAGHYACDATRAWSDKIGHADGFVFVSPQYNWGYPAPLKNAIDHLHREWTAKLAIIVTYGGHGGGKCAEQLRQVFDGLTIATMPTMPALKLARAAIEANSGEIDCDRAFAGSAEIVRRAFAELRAAIDPPSG